DVIIWRCISFISFRITQHPISNILPYTTLFRSSESAAHRSGAVLRAPGTATTAVDDGRHGDRHEGDDEGDERPRGTGSGVDDGGDRKSTRLNSSHVSISYAVFCLKKKKANTPAR